jgi:hypothetical protein
VLHDPSMNLMQVFPIPVSAFAAAAFVVASAGTSDAAHPLVHEPSAVFAPLLRDEAAHARLSGYTCVYARLWPTTNWTSYLSSRNGWMRLGDVSAGISVGLARRLDGALRAAAPVRSTVGSGFRIRSVPPPLGPSRGRPAGRCDLTMQNPIGQVSFSRPVFSGDFAFVEVQGLVWGTNPPPLLRALQRTRRGWVIIAEQLAD